MIKASRLQVPADVPNLQYVLANNIPYETTRECIANANLPIMVTGDGSLNLALEYEKPFFYETQYWKQESSRSLKEIFSKTSAFKGNYKDLRLLAKSLPSSPPVGKGQPVASPRTKDILEVMNDIDYQRKLEAAMKETRSQHTLLGTWTGCSPSLRSTEGILPPPSLKNSSTGIWARPAFPLSRL